MAQDLSSQLTITASADGVVTEVGRAKRSLSDLGATAQAAGKQASAGLDTIGKGADAASKKVQTATSNLVSSIQRQIATVEAGSRGGSKFFETLAEQRGVSVDVLRPYLDQLDQVIAKQKEASKGAKTVTGDPVTSGFARLGDQGRANLQRIQAADRLTAGLSESGRLAAGINATTIAASAGATALNNYGLSAKQTAAALRQVPAQLTDIVTSLQAGQAPLTVLLQQGGQLRDVFGGIAPAAKALGGAVLGLINPFTIAAAAAVALGLAYKQGSSEADEFARAIILSGNAAGTTVGQLQGMAESISKVAGTQGKAAEALAQFAATGDIGAANLERFSLAAIRLERVTGQAIGETVKQFAGLAKEPLQAALKLNETTRFLTQSLYTQIKALDDVGRTADAAALAQRGYADAIESRTSQLEDRLGSLERAWKGVGDTARRAWDFMLNVGRPDTLQSQLSVAEQRVKDLQSLAEQIGSGQRRAGLGGIDKGQIAAEIAAEQARIVQLSKRVDSENAYAAAAKISADQVRARAEFDKDGIKYLNDRVKLERDIAKAIAQGREAGASQPEIDKRVADIRADFAKKQPKGPKPVDTDRSELQAQLAAAKNLLDEQVAQARNTDTILEALRSAGLVNERAYYAEKRRLIEEATQAESDALANQIGALQAANAAIESLTGRKREEKEPQRLDNQRKIADAEAQILRLREGTSARLVVLSIQEEAAAKRLAASFLTARQAAQDAFDVMQRQQARDLEGFGQGQQQRGRNAGVSQIEDRFADQRRELENQRALLEAQGQFTEEARQQYAERLRIIQEFQAKSIASFEEYYDKLQARERDASLGALEALRNYADEAVKVGKQIEGAIGNALNGLEDKLTDFVVTGKLSLSSLAESITRDYARIFVRQNITGPLAEAATGLFGGKPAAAANPAAAAQTAQTAALQQSKVALDSLAQAATSAAQALNSRPGAAPGFAAFDTSGAGTNQPSEARDALRRIEASSGEPLAAASELQAAFGGTREAAYQCGQAMLDAKLGIGRLGDASSLAGLALQALPSILKAIQGLFGPSQFEKIQLGLLENLSAPILPSAQPSIARDALRQIEASVDPNAEVGAFTQAVTEAVPQVRDLGVGSGEAASGLGDLPQALSGLFDGLAGSLGNLFSSLGGGDTLGSLASLFGGFFEKGGRPPVALPSIVGERGVEMFIPDTIAAQVGPRIASAPSGSVGGHAPVLVGQDGPQIIVPASPGTVLSHEQTTRLIERIERERIEALQQQPAVAATEQRQLTANTVAAAVAPPAVAQIAPPISVSLTTGRTDGPVPHEVRSPAVLAADHKALGVNVAREAAAAPETALARIVAGDIAVHVKAPPLAPAPAFVLPPSDAKAPQINLTAKNTSVSKETRDRFERFDRWRESIRVDGIAKGLDLPQSASADDVLNKLRRLQFFSNGGYTGPGRRDEPAGVVHKGEVVWSQLDIARAGGVEVVEAMRKGKRGYADGGVVEIPFVPQPRSGSSAPVVNMPVRIINNGAPMTGRTERRSDGGIDVILDTVEKRLGRRIDNGTGLAKNIGGRFGLNGGGTLPV